VTRNPSRALDLKSAAALAGVHERSMRRWCQDQVVAAFRLASGTGPWRVVVDEFGQPCDPPPVKSRRRR
jgi:hypothetical protein